MRLLFAFLLELAGLLGLIWAVPGLYYIVCLDLSFSEEILAQLPWWFHGLSWMTDGEAAVPVKEGLQEMESAIEFRYWTVAVVSSLLLFCGRFLWHKCRVRPSTEVEPASESRPDPVG